MQRLRKQMEEREGHELAGASGARVQERARGGGGGSTALLQARTAGVGGSSEEGGGGRALVPQPQMALPLRLYVLVCRTDALEQVP